MRLCREPTVTRGQEALLWSAVAVPIAAWMAHLSAVASLVGLTNDRPDVKWVIHGLTIGLTLVCVLLGVLIWPFVNRPESSVRFLARLALSSVVANIILILWEGSYVLFLSPHR